MLCACVQGGHKTKMPGNYNIGIYCRLSRDNERTGESVSIENHVNHWDGVAHLLASPGVSAHAI